MEFMTEFFGLFASVLTMSILTVPFLKKPFCDFTFKVKVTHLQEVSNGR